MDMANTLPTTNEHVTADDLNKEIVTVSDSDSEDEITDALEKMSNNRLYQELDDIRYKNETMMVNLNHRSILVPALHKKETLVELTRKETITAQIRTQLKYNKNLRNYFVSGTIIKQDIDRMFFFKAKNARGRRKNMIIKKNTNREHKTWSNGSYIKQQPLQQQQQQPQNPEVEVIDEPIEIINVEDQVRDDDSVKSIDTMDTDLNRDFACFEMDETHLDTTHTSLENCSMLPFECRSITSETEEYGNGHYQDVLATAIKEAERMFSDQTIECYQDDIDNKKMIDPSAITTMDVPDAIKEAESMLSDQTIECYQDNIDNKRMIDPSNITQMNVPDMTPVEELTQGKTHTEFFINQTKPLDENEGCILLEKEQIRPQIIKFRKH